MLFFNGHGSLWKMFYVWQNLPFGDLSQPAGFYALNHFTKNNPPS